MTDNRSNYYLWSNLFGKHDPWEEMVAKLWAATPLFKGIHLKDIIKLARNMHPRLYQPQEIIFHAHDQGAGAALILSGKIEIRCQDVSLAVLEAGDFFGEVSLVLDEPRTADAIALEPSKLAFFLRMDLEEWIAKAPHLGAKLSTNLAHTLAQRLLHANQMLANTGQLS